MNTLRLKAENSAKAFYQRRQNEPIEALAGDGVGNMNVTGRLQWIYVRMAGDSTKVSQAYNRSGYTFAENDSIVLRWVKRTGMGFYQVDGYSGSVVYDVSGGGGSGTGTGVANHAWQHERMDAGQGGPDPLDIFARMVVPLRARPQTVPDDTLYVEAGYNPLTGNYWAGGNSASFFPVPGTAGQARIDLLYLGSDDLLHIVAGTPVGGGVTPTLPAVVVPSVPLAFVYLAYGQLTIVEGNIYRDPGILRSPVGAVNAGVTSIRKSGAALLTGAVTLSQGANITLTQAAQDIQIAAAGGGHTIQDEGSDMAAETHLNFVGAGVTVTDDAGNTATKVTIPGGSLEVKEIDGAPDVTGVAIIQVTNGKLTDNGGGNITLDLSGGGGGPHDLLDGSVDQDTTASTVTRGDLIVGNSTPKWDDLAIGTARQLLAVNAGGTDPEWASFDWDNAGAASGADMVHDHSAAGEGDKLAQANTHETPDTDAATSSLHHTIGSTATTAAAGNHTHSTMLDAGISLVINDGGIVLTAGAKFDFAVPWNGTITGWDLISDLSGNITVDLLDAAYGSFPGSAASIWGIVPALAGAQRAQSSGLSIAITKGHWMQVSVTGPATMTRCTLALYITRS